MIGFEPASFFYFFKKLKIENEGTQTEFGQVPGKVIFGRYGPTVSSVESRWRIDSMKLGQGTGSPWKGKSTRGQGGTGFTGLV